MASVPTVAAALTTSAKSSNGLTPINAGLSGEIQKVTVLIAGQPRKMWQCRYCSHVSKRRANVRLHEKKHFKFKHHGSSPSLVNSSMIDRRLNDNDETGDCPAGPSNFVLHSPKKRMLNQYKERCHNM